MTHIHRQRGYANTRAIRVGFGIFTVAMMAAAYIYMYGAAFAAFNPEINYQGKLTGSTNVAVADGTYHMRFRLYTAETGGTLVHLEDRSNVAGNRVSVTNGLFSIMIGSSSALTSVDFNQPLWLEVEVGGTASSSWETLSPRKRLGAVPAAFEAGRLDGVDSTQFVRSDEPDTIASTTSSTLLTITQSGTGDILNLFDGATEVFSVLDGGNVGIGTSSPMSKLSVGGDAFITGNATATNIIATGTLTILGNTSLQNASTTNLTIANRLFDGTGSAGANGYVLQTTGSGVQWVATSSLGFSGGVSTFLALTDTPDSYTANRVLFTNAGATGLTDSANFVFTGTNLGIGSTSPIAELVVASANPSFVVDDNDAAGTQLEFVSSGATAYIRSGTDSSDTAARFRVVRSGTTATNIANFDIYATTTFLNGFLGIGTTTPQSEIVVHDASGDSIIAVSGSNSANRGFNLNLLDGSAAWSFVMDTNEDLVLREFRSGNDDFRIQNTAGTDLFFLDTSAGTLGIGTSTPSSVLTVAGAGLFSGNLQAANITATGTLSVTGAATLSATLGVAGHTTLATASTTNLSANYLAVGQSGSTTISTTGALTSSALARLLGGASTTNLSANYLAVGQSGSTTISTAGALATPALTIASLTGPLQAINGVVSATSSIQDAFIADNITVSGATIGSNSIAGTWTTTGTLTIGDGGDRIDVNSSGWDVTNSVFTNGTWQGNAIGTAYGGTGITATPNDGELLIGDGLGFTLSTITAGSGINISNGAGSITITNASTTQWSTNGTSIFYNTGNVGIGTSSPRVSLQVASNTPYIAITDLNGEADQKHWLLSHSGSGMFRIGQGNDALTSTTTKLLIDSVSDNFYVGSITGTSTGTNNTGIGYQTLRSNVSGTDNNAFGAWALYRNTIGTGNTAIGLQALFSNTSGVENNAVGGSALYNNTIGTDNTALGSSALYLNTRGSFNNAIGTFALPEVTTGSYNVGIGYQSGTGFTTGTSSTFIGRASGVSSGTLSTSTALGAGAIVGCSQCLVLGGTGQNAVNVGIGTSTPAWTLQVASSATPYLALSNMAGSANNKHWLLSNSGDGIFRIGQATDDLTSTSSQLIIDNQNRNFTVGSGVSTGVYNNAIGFNSLYYNTTGSDNNAFGNSALMGSSTAGQSGAGNNAFGYRSLYQNATGNSNNALGSNSLYYNTSGSYNNALGEQALQGSSTAGQSGSHNNALGYRSLYKNATGDYNNAIGNVSLSNNDSGSYNNAFGYNALSLNTTGSYNEAYGVSALSNNTIGFGNTALGNNALGLNTTGAYNIGVGVEAGGSIYSITGWGNIAIGTNTHLPNPTGNRQLNIGNILYGTLAATSTNFQLPTTGGIGIGSTSPMALLTVHANNGDTRQNLFVIGSSTATATSTLFTVTNTGKVGIGYDNPMGRLSVSSANSTQTWSQVGTGLTVSVASVPSLATLSPNRIAVMSGSGATLRTYEWNGSTWAAVGNSLTITGAGNSAITALSPNRVAFVDQTNASLRVYEWNGTTWTQIGTGLSIAGTGVPALTALSPNRIAFIDGSNDSLRVYEWNGTTWVQVGNSFVLSNDLPALTTLSPNRVAFIDGNNESLRTYEWNGSTWAQIGTGLSIAGTGVPALTTLSPNRVAFLDETNESLRTYEWNGSAWVQVGSSLAITSINSLAITALSPNRIAFIDQDNDSLRTYQFSNSLLFVGDSLDYPFLSVSDSGYTTAEGLSVRSALTIGQNATSTWGTTTPALVVNGRTVFSNLVGIGTTTPTAQLSIVDSNVSTTSTLFSISSSAGSSLLTVDSVGKTGVGTSTPHWIFQVATATPYIGITDTDAGIGGKQWFLANNNGTLSFGTTTDNNLNATSSLFSITNSSTTLARAFVVTGAGTSTITDGLSVGTTLQTAALRLTGGLYDTNNTAGTNGMVLQTTGSGVQWVATSTLGLGGGGGSGTVNSGTLGQLAYYAANGTAVSGSSNLYLNPTTNNFGIGSSSPHARLSIDTSTLGTTSAFLIGSSTATLFKVMHTGNIGVGSSSPTSKLTVLDTYTTATTVSAYLPVLSVVRDISLAADDSAIHYGGRFELNTPTTNANTLDTLKGFESKVINRGTGAVGNITGNDVYVYNASSSIAGGMYGASQGAETYGGVVSAVTGTQVYAGTYGGSVTDLYGILLYTDNGGASLTNRYGVYLAAPVGTTTSANDFGFYQAGNQKNYLGGRLGIGTSTPYWDLQVASTTGSPYLALSNIQGSANNKHWLISNSGDGIFRIGKATDALSGSSTKLLIDATNENTRIGSQSGTSTGTNNIAIGGYALYSNTSGTDNNSLGYQTLYFSTSGSRNNAFGSQALRGTSTAAHIGNDNNAFGSQALYLNALGDSNNAFGNGTLTFNSTGDYNNALGYQSMLGSTTVGHSGSNNNAFGFQSLFRNATGNYNNAFGYQSLYYNTSGSNNNALGYQALFNNLAGADNVAIGQNALRGSTTAFQTGSNNVAIGSSALTNNASGIQNIVLGESAGTYNSSGSYNIVLGQGALQGSSVLGQSGWYNTALGIAALTNNTTGSANIAVGRNALQVNTTGADNVALGQYSASNNTTGWGNITIGTRTYLPTDTGNRQLNIGNILYGSLPATSTSFQLPTSGGIGIGSTSPMALLTIHGNQGDTRTNLFVIGSTSGSGATSTLFSVSNSGTTTIANGVNIATGCYAVNGTCLTSGTNYFTNSDTSTYLSTGSKLGIGTTTPYWQLQVASTTGSPYLALSNMGGSTNNKHWLLSNSGDGIFRLGKANDNQTSTSTLFIIDATGDNVMLGDGQIGTTSGTGNVGVGVGTLRRNNGTIDNVGIGNAALFGSTTSSLSGNYNVGIGSAALQNNASGGENVGIGRFALTSNDAGGWNVGIGSGALQMNLTGSQSVAIGRAALGVETTGGNNVALGPYALGSSVGGNTNIAVGNQAGYDITTGDNNLILGVGGNTGNSITSGSSNILIGYDVRHGLTSSGSSQLNIGNLIFSRGLGTGSTTATGNVGISTSSPYAKLSVHSNAGGAATTDIFVIASSSSSGTGTTTLFTVSGSGTTTIANGVNIATGCYAVNGTCLSTGSGSGTVNSGTFGQLAYYAADGTAVSGSSNLYLNTTNNAFGIGTTSPHARLSVDSSSLGTTSAFLIGSSTKTLFKIDNTGLVGIGTSSPVAALSLHNPTAGAGAVSLGFASGYNGISLTNGTVGSNWNFLSSYTDPALYIRANSGSNIKFQHSDGADMMRIQSSGKVGIGTSSPSWLLQVATTSPSIAITDTDAGVDLKHWTLSNNGGAFSIGTTSDSLGAGTTYFTIASGGYVGIGTTSPTSLLGIQKTGVSGSAIVGMNQYFNFQNAVTNAVQYGDSTYIVNAPTVANTLVGKMIRIEDSTALANTVRGLEVQAHRGTNTAGENTAISGFGRTFGVRGTTEGDAGSVFEPAGLYGETRGTSQGNAIRGLSTSITTANLMSLYQATSTFAGTGLEMDFGNSTGSFSSSTSKFLDLKVAGVSKFMVMSSGTVAIASSSPTARLSVDTTSLDSTPAFVIGSSTKTNFIVSNTGRVAVGTSSPDNNGDGFPASFTIQGTDSRLLSIVNPTQADGTSNFIVLGKDFTTNDSATIKFRNVSNGSTSNRLTFGFYNTDDILNIIADEKVGIATTAPWGTLSVTNTGATRPSFVVEDSASPDSTPFLIDNSGNVGIGSSSPTGPLDVVGNLVSSVLKLKNTNASGWSSIDMYDNLGGAITSMGYGNTSASAFPGLSYINSNLSKPLVFGIEAAEKMRIDSTGNIGIGTTSPWARLTVLGSSTSELNPVFVFATTSLWQGTAGHRPILWGFATTTGDLNRERVAIGTTSVWGNMGGIRDSLTVDGRIYSTWLNLNCVAGSSMSSTSIQVDTAGVCGDFSFDSSSDGRLLTQDTYPPKVRLSGGITTSFAAGEAAMLRSASLLAPATSSPVFEARVGIPTHGGIAQTDGKYYIVGLADMTFGTSSFPGTPKNGAFFIASTSNNWSVVVKSGGATSTLIDTGVATSSGATNLNLNRFRIELTGTRAIFLINGAVVASVAPSNMPQTPLAPIVGVYAGRTVSTTNVHHIDVSYIQAWIDDPATTGGDGETLAQSDMERTVSDPSLNLVSQGDIAEFYQVASTSEYVPGMLVSARGERFGYVSHTAGAYDDALMGAISTNPQTVLGVSDSGLVQVSLAGRAPVIVSLENGPIAQGDAIVSSNIPGVGMRAGMPGNVIGHALEAVGPGSCDIELEAQLEDIGVVELPENACVVRILTTIEPGFSVGSAPLFGEAATSTASFATLAIELASEVFEQGAMFTKFVVGQVTAKVAYIGSLFAEEVHTKKLCVADAAGNETCITKEQLDALLISSMGTPVPPGTVGEGNSGGGTGGTGTTTGNGNGQGNSNGQGNGNGTTDTEAPIVAVVGGTTVNVTVGETYTDQGAMVSDNVDTSSTYTVSLDGGAHTEPSALSLDTSAAGTHWIEYRAVDAAGNVGTATRNIIVELATALPPPGPTPPPNPDPVPPQDPPPSDPPPEP